MKTGIFLSAATRTGTMPSAGGGGGRQSVFGCPRGVLPPPTLTRLTRKGGGGTMRDLTMDHLHLTSYRYSTLIYIVQK